MPSDKGLRLIRLHQPSGNVDIQTKNVFFTFGDGRLSYDCVSCQSKCCRGHGYLATFGTELETQLRLRPSLPLFLEPSGRPGANYLGVTNCAPGCFFLGDDGRCEVHAMHGHAAKPETCRLFPFNAFRQVGAFLVVAPHQELCPLSIANSEIRSPESAYDGLLEEMLRRGISTRVRHASTGGRDVAEVVARERNVVELAERSLNCGDYLTFAVAQMNLSRPADAHLEGVQNAAVHSLVQLAHDLLGTPERATLGHEPDLVRTMIAMTPLLRSRLVFHETDGGAAARGLPLPEDRLPHAMIAAYLFTEAASRAGTAPVTYQTISRMFPHFEVLLKVLAQADMHLTWQKDAPIDVAAFATSERRMQFLRLAKALLPQAQRRNSRALGVLLRSYAPADPVQRVLFLKEAAQAINGKLVPLDSASRFRAPLRTRVKTAIHRWSLMNLDDAGLRTLHDQPQSNG